MPRQIQITNGTECVERRRERGEMKENRSWSIFERRGIAGGLKTSSHYIAAAWAASVQYPSEHNESAYNSVNYYYWSEEYLTENYQEAGQNANARFKPG